MENLNIMTYFMVKSYMDGKKDSGDSCTKDEAIAYVKKLLLAATETVSPGKASKECYDCKYGSIFPGSSHHIKCSNLDPFMKGDEHGIKNGWFIYPLNFDPAWKIKNCINYERKSD